ncbi:AraC family transcriptional regulator [Pantoea agglomerans]|jgi:AraC-like DNA-binding protein|uniref:AraC family transcriptional regulator n=1 Tax=Enterobacter agglomerans TaxID=549 RepID=UPI0010095B2F|nr:AraC family transcriptional regulator [Pantoea agglomerans]QAV47536.1 AraC family transcriptional regulator [Pantoea agglomerans]QAV52259.1 AraC family transcriptional regulator [Pantoea agglomerans]WNK42333.1 AraC family transcriptional regulator [Pantoea agglomerans]WNK51290.1 AraC family transcriptional regulator [Pantoea agglomerans]
MDILSQLLSLLRPESYVSGGVKLAAKSSVQWPSHDGVKCYAIVSGECWLSVEGNMHLLRLQKGDCFLLPPGPPFRLATELSAKAVDFTTVRTAMVSAEEAGEKPCCLLVGGHFLLAGQAAKMLLEALPAVVHIRNPSDKAAMQWALERMVQEICEPQPGSALIVQQLAFMLLIQALRLYANENQKIRTGWLFALRDKKLSAALTSMHQNPEYKWTIAKLAGQAGMSRAAFAKHFKQTVGTTPVEYLTQWRMMLACEQLNYSDQTIAQIAAASGYESESAFAKAFKRTVGCSPGKVAAKRKP